MKAKNKTNIVLIGFMGTGKSITGKLLAYRLGYKFVDTDTQIERKYKQKIKQMFARDGEAVFRQRETATIREIASRNYQVISTGGGVATRKENMDILREHGIVVALTATPQTIMKRTNNNRRPLLAYKTGPERLKIIKELMAKRAEYYKQADLIIHTDYTTPIQNIERIVKFIKEV